MADKVDLVMWTKNGAFFLPMVLKRVEDVFPFEDISNKIIIDDHSTDDTAKVAESHNWQVYENPGRGVSAAANEALRRVQSRRFVSIEQDLVLAKEWWERIPPMLDKKGVVAASGVRVPDGPDSLRLISEYTNERNEQQLKLYIGFRYGKTLDNTIYDADSLRKLGGFPRMRINAGVDGALVKRINDAGCLWKVNFDVVSVHLRRGIVNELRHNYWYGAESKALSRLLGEKENVPLSSFKRALFSPARGLQIAAKKRCWEIALLYPLIRVSIFMGVLKGIGKAAK